MFRADCGGSAPHVRSISSSGMTTSFALTASIAKMQRCLACPNSMCFSVSARYSTGPNN